VTVTFVGNVLTGTNVLAVPSGTSVIAPPVPVAGTLDTTNGFPVKNNNQVQIWSPTANGFTGYTYSSSTGWNPSDPQLTVGQSVFVTVKSATAWTDILNVQ